MCGRYQLYSTPTEVANAFGVDVRDNFPPRYNIAPTQPIAMIRMNDAHKRDYALARWGFAPEWAKGEFLERLKARPLINARAETAAEKPTFRSAFKRRRCLIPADGFYEWKTGKDGKQPFCVRRRAEGPFAFAGLWETALDAGGGEMDTVAILTTAAGQDLRPLHSREPVVIAPQSFTLWLEGDERDLASLGGLLSPAPENYWTYFPVSKEVNSPSHDGPELIEELA